MILFDHFGLKVKLQFKVTIEITCYCQRCFIKIFVRQNCCGILNYTYLCTVIFFITEKMNARFQIAIHILTLLDKSDVGLLSSDFIAGSLNTNPALVRKEISNLRNHGFITSKEGKGGGYVLAKSSAEITMADVYKTVKTGALLGTSKNELNPKCPVGRQISGEINKLYEDVDTSVLNKLATISLAKFTEGFN